MVGGVIGAGITFCIFTISTNHGNTRQAIRRATILQHKCLIVALNLHVKTHFTEHGKIYFSFLAVMLKIVLKPFLRHKHHMCLKLQNLNHLIMGVDSLGVILPLD